MKNKPEFEMIQNERGGSLVEFAIVMPLLFMILFGIIDFGILLYDKAVITNAGREGARFGIVQVLNESNGEPTRHSATEISDVVSTYCTDRLVTFEENVNVSVLPKAYRWNETDETYDEISLGSAKFGDDLRVQVTYSYTYLAIPKIPGVGLDDATVDLTTTTVMKYE